MTHSVDIFIAFAQADAELYAQLNKHLGGMKNRGEIRSYSAADVPPGEDWRTVLRSKVSSAKIVLLLVSADFISSKTWFDIGESLVQQSESVEEAKLIPVVVRPCDWKSGQFGHLKALPDNHVAVTSWRSHDEAWLNVVQGIRAALAAISTRRIPPTTSPYSAATAPMPVGAAHGLLIPPTRLEPAVPYVPPDSNSDPANRTIGRASSPSSHGPEHAPLRPSLPRESYGGGHSTSIPPIPSGPHVVAVEPHASTGVARAMHGGPSRKSITKLIAVGAVAVAVFAIAIAGVLGLVGWDSEEDVTGSQAAHPPSSQPHAPPRAEERPPAAASDCESPCCGGESCRVDEQNKTNPRCAISGANCEQCPSGRACVPGTCKRKLEPTRPFNVRLAEVIMKSGEPLPDGAEVCIRRSTPEAAWICTPYPGLYTRMPATTADLMSGRGIDIEIRVQGSLIAMANRAAHSSLLNSVLCRGVRFEISSVPGLFPSTPIGDAVFYLDEP